jgi:hypothetical protein
VFLGGENYIGCTNAAATINTLVSDNDRDSLYTRFSELLNRKTSGPFNPPVNPTLVTFDSIYTFDNPLPYTPPNVGATLDSTTGQINHLRVSQGHSALGLRVESWRGGELIGVVYRDWSILTATCDSTASGANTAPALSANWVSFPLQFQVVSPSHWRVWTEPNTPVVLNLNSIDSDLAPTTFLPQNIVFEGKGLQLSDSLSGTQDCSQPPCAQVLPQAGQTGYVSPVQNNVQFSWTPDVHHLFHQRTTGFAESPYLFELKMTDDHCPVPLESSLLLEIYVTVTPPSAPQLLSVNLDSTLNAVVDWAAPVDSGGGLTGLFVYHNSDPLQPSVFHVVDSIIPTTPNPMIIDSSDVLPSGLFFIASMGLDGNPAATSDTLDVANYVAPPGPAQLNGVTLDVSGDVLLDWTAPLDTGDGLGGLHIYHDASQPQVFVVVDSILNSSQNPFIVGSTLYSMGGSFFIASLDLNGDLTATSDTLAPSNLSIREETQGDELIIFPNPLSGDVVQVKLPRSGKYKWVLVDVTGRVVTEGSIQGSHGELSLSDLPTGSYVIRFSDGSAVFTTTLQVE